jgi:hypothetical protein
MRADHVQHPWHQFEGLRRLRKLHIDLKLLISSNIYDLEILLSYPNITSPRSLQDLTFDGFFLRDHVHNFIRELHHSLGDVEKLGESVSMV